MVDIQTEINLAKEALDAKDYDNAHDICLAALKDSESKTLDEREVKDRLELLVTMTDVLKNQGRLFDNLMYINQVIDGARAINDHETLATGLTRAGFVFNKMGKREKAMVMFDEAEAIVKNFKNRVQYGYVLAGKANIFWRSGENRKAIETAGKVLGIGLENEEYVLAGGAASIISSAWFERGEFDEALKAAKLSVETYRNAGNTSDMARALNNQGEVYKRMHDFDKAIETYEEGVSVVGKDVKRLGYLYTNLAECHARKGELDVAEEEFAKAREVLKDSEDKYAVACTWFVRGLLEDAHGRTDNGMEWLVKAERRMEHLGVPYDLGVFRYELAQVYLKMGRVDLAVDMIHKAIDVLTRAGSKDLVDDVKELVKS